MRIDVGMGEQMGEKNRYILGIDQGGTKTAAAVMRSDGVLVGKGKARGAYFPTQGMDAAMEPVREAALAALKEAAVDEREIALTVAGVTGLDYQGDDAAVEQAVRKLFPTGEVIACNDAVIAFYSGATRSHGAVICAGTGMNGALIDRKGRRFIYGDYMDENVQGGSALALRAVRKVFDAQLGLCGETALTELFLAHAAVEDVDALLRRYMMEDGFRGKLRYLVPEIMRIAEEGDEAACALLDDFAAQIVAYLDAGFRKMGMLPDEEEIVLTGNVFKGEALRRRVQEQIAARFPGAEVVSARYEPEVGACIMGLIHRSMDVTKVEEVMRESAAALGLLRC